MRRFPLLLAGLVLALPTAAAQFGGAGCVRQCLPHDADVDGAEAKTGASAVKSILYFHFASLVDNPPINLQLPDEREPTVNQGFLLPTLVLDGTGTPADEAVNFRDNEFGGVSSAGFVEFGADGDRRIHEEPGLAEDLVFTNATAALYLYLSAYPVPSENSGAGPPGASAVPQVGVHAWITEGRFPGRGKVLGEGDTGLGGVADAVGGDARNNIVLVPGQGEIYEFRVPVKLAVGRIGSIWNGGTGFAVAFRPYQFVAREGPGRGTAFTQSEWRARIGPTTPVRLVVEHANPLVTKSLRITHFNHALYARWSVVSPWGSYDVDERSLRVALTGPSVPDSEKTGLARPLVVKTSTDHEGHFKPLNATWRFSYRDLVDGGYELHLSAANLQGTYRLDETLTFRVEHGLPVGVEEIGGASPGRETGHGTAGGQAPAVEAVPLLAALGAVARARRVGRGT